MSKGRIEEAVDALARPVAEELGYELVDVEYAKEGTRWVLRLFIDGPDGITVDDCEAVSKGLDPLLEEADIVQKNYVLEVSSPGAERPLKKDDDFSRFQGRTVEVRTFAPLEGRKIFTGQLGGLRDGNVVVHVEGREWIIPQAQVSTVRLRLNW